MNRRIAVALGMLVALALAGPSYAQFDPPYITNCIIPTAIHLVGSTAGVPDVTSGRFTVTIRDIASNPVAGANVTVDFSNCTDLRIASDQLDPSLTVNCTYRTVAAQTNVSGIATFTVIGSSANTGTYASSGTVRLYWDGVLLGIVPGSAFDLNGAGGVTGADLSVWLGDLGSGGYRARSDFDGSGTVSGADFSVWLGALGRQGSSVSGSVCP